MAERMVEGAVTDALGQVGEVSVRPGGLSGDFEGAISDVGRVESFFVTEAEGGEEGERRLASSSQEILLPELGGIIVGVAKQSPEISLRTDVGEYFSR